MVTYSFYIFLSHMKLLRGVLKGFIFHSLLCLLNNLKPCFKGDEGIMGDHTQACVAAGPGSVRHARGVWDLLLTFLEVSFKL